MKEVKSKVLSDLIKTMGSRSVKGLKKGEAVEAEIEVKKEGHEPEERPASLHVSADCDTVDGLKKKLDSIFG